LNFVPGSRRQADDLARAILRLKSGCKAEMPFRHDLLGELKAEIGGNLGSDVKQNWKNNALLWGSLTGNTLGQLPDDVQKELWSTFVPNADGPEQFQEQNFALRSALDQAGVEK